VNFCAIEILALCRIIRRRVAEAIRSGEEFAAEG
jgi:hypothetical protein